MNTKPLPSTTLTIASSSDRNQSSPAAKEKKGATLRLLNPKREPLTADTLTTFTGFEALSTEELEAKCTSIRSFVRLLLQHLTTVENTCGIDNQHVVHSSCDQEGKVIPFTINTTYNKAA